MSYVITILITASISYAFGYIARGWVDADKRRVYRKQMGLPDISKECENCLNLGIDCDPNCQYILKEKELKERVERTKNNTEEN